MLFDRLTQAEQLRMKGMVASGAVGSSYPQYGPVVTAQSRVSPAQNVLELDSARGYAVGAGMLIHQPVAGSLPAQAAFGTVAALVDTATRAAVLVASGCQLLELPVRRLAGCLRLATFAGAVQAPVKLSVLPVDVRSAVHGLRLCARLSFRSARSPSPLRLRAYFTLLYGLGHGRPGAGACCAGPPVEAAIYDLELSTCNTN